MNATACFVIETQKQALGLYFLIVLMACIDGRTIHCTHI